MSHENQNKISPESTSTDPAESTNILHSNRSHRSNFAEDELLELLNEIKEKNDEMEQQVEMIRLQAQQKYSNCYQSRTERDIPRHSSCQPTHAQHPNYDFPRPSTDPLPRNSLRFDDIIKSFKKFKGDYHNNISSWLNHFNEQSQIFSLSPLEKFVFAKRLMVGTAKNFVEYESKATTFHQLAAELLEEFGKSVNSALVHQKLQERKKKKEETPTQYLYEMLTLASQSDIDTAAIITYTINGLPGSNNFKAHMYDADNLKDFKKKLMSYEIQYAMTKNDLKTVKTEQPTEKIDPTEALADCSRRDKGPKCFACGKFGHVKSDCLNSKSSNANKINIIQRIDEDRSEGSDNDQDEFRMSPSDEERMYKKSYYQSKSR